MEIAPGIQAEAWNRLHLDDPASEDWSEAIRIFRERIEKRYLLPAKHLIDMDEFNPPYKRTFGFSIMAINCLLSETLQAFVEGVTDTRHQSEALITQLLTTCVEFSSHFDKELAQYFYQDVRCGILHIGETRRDAIVWSIGPLVVPYKNSIRVNRTEFNRQLEARFRRYCDELASDNNAAIRARFRVKMDFVARRKPSE